MGVISKVTLTMLAEKLEKGPCVSIYIPTHRAMGVVYNPPRERCGNDVRTGLPKR